MLLPARFLRLRGGLASNTRRSLRSSPPAILTAHPPLARRPNMHAPPASVLPVDDYPADEAFQRTAITKSPLAAFFLSHTLKLFLRVPSLQPLFQLIQERTSLVIAILPWATNCIYEVRKPRTPVDRAIVMPKVSVERSQGIGFWIARKRLLFVESQHSLSDVGQSQVGTNSARIASTTRSRNYRCRRRLMLLKFY